MGHRNNRDEGGGGGGGATTTIKPLILTIISKSELGSSPWWEYAFHVFGMRNLIDLQLPPADQFV